MCALAHHIGMMSDGRAGQGRLLGILLDHNGITQRDLQDIVVVRSGSLSEVLGKLESAALIERHPSPEDRRLMRVFLTEEGIRAARACTNRHAEALARTYNCLTEPEKEQLFTLATRISNHIEETSPHGRDAHRGGRHHRGRGPRGGDGKGFS